MPDEACKLIHEKLETHTKMLEKHEYKIETLEKEREKSDDVLNGLREDFVRFAVSIETSVKSMSLFIKFISIAIPALWAFLTYFHVKF